MRFTAILAAVAASLVSAQSENPNDPCAPQALGYAPPTPGSASNFLQNPVYPALSQFATTPTGYSRSFNSLQGATSGADYLGFAYLQTYNTTGCASLCNNTPSCIAFNIYIERDPLLNPAPACPNPPSIANYKCSFWGAPVTAQNATNVGQYRQQFQVVIAGSDGYNKN